MQAPVDIAGMIDGCVFAQAVELLTERGLMLKKGTIVDSMLIEAPSSTKNRDRKRDPEAHQVKKGNAWHFGYKAHIGVDKDSGLAHHVKATAASVSDVATTPSLLAGEEQILLSAYLEPAHFLSPIPFYHILACSYSI